MIYLGYMVSELRRRRGRTILTTLGLAVGIALVITVGALSAGLDSAQAKVLEPLTGVGTDMSVTRPITLSEPDANSSSGQGPPQLSEQERRQLEQENGAPRVGFGDLEPGEKFSETRFQATQLTFPSAKAAKISAIGGVESATGGLALNLTTVSGTVPEQAEQGGALPGGGGGGFAGPRSIAFDSISVSGVDERYPELGAITSGQVAAGKYFTSGSSRQAILNVSYAKANDLEVGSKIDIKGKQYTVIGLVETPLGGASSDVYVKLSQLQKMSDRAGRVNTVFVRADSASDVAAVADEIEATFDGASVTTAEELAAKVTGSLTTAKDLSEKLGFALQLVGLLAAIGLASLLTLSSVAKRVRELGTLKAIGWSQRLVVRQVTGEALLVGVLGGILGIALGVAGAALVTAFAPELEASVGSAAQGVLPGPAAFGQGAVETTSEAVSLTAQVSLGLAAVAVVLAVLAGLVSGAAGGLRAARLRPADALRHID